MQKVFQRFAKHLDSSTVEKTLKKGGAFHFHSVPKSSHSFLLKSLFLSLKNTILYIAPTNSEAEAIFREAGSFFSEDEIIYYPGPEGIPYDYAKFSPEIKRDRITALSSFQSSKNFVIITSVMGVFKKLPPARVISEKSLIFEKGKEYDRDTVLSSLSSLGYMRELICEEYGKYSVKGSVIDVYTAFHNYPIRLDFFGDTLESIKSFDPNTQRSIANLDSITISPADEFVLTRSEKETYKKNLEKLSNGKKLPQSDFDDTFYLEELNGLAHETCGLLDYFKTPPIVVISDKLEISSRTLQNERVYNQLYETRREEIVCLPPEELLSFKEEYSILKSEASVIIFDALAKHDGDENQKILPLKEVESFKGRIRDVRDKIIELKNSKKAIIIITSSFAAQTERLMHLFEKEEIQILNQDSEDPSCFDIPEKPGLYLVLSELRYGFTLQEEEIYFWSDNDIFGRAYKKKSRFKKNASRSIESFIDLKEGDHIVHIHHGVGKFIKIEKTTAAGKIRDFLKIEYARGDTLFVPLDQISLVQRYVGNSEHPALDSLGQNAWKKKKERAQESVDKLAEELMVVYANRMQLSGYTFPPDTIWQEEFEAEFEFEETPDQLSAIEAVKSDLENPRPMDRLICGDVGYGKTEVAIRAAFKVMMAGKQVLFLAPTTILVLQHFNTFSERFKNYPIKIEMVSRFRTYKEIKNALEKFKKGELDLLVGTHTLLTPNLKPKNLGLLIIDEEQKFGVVQKDTIKKIKQMVDVLTMSATPIPRTLHLSLSGIRDLSIIETPPKNRQSVETYILEDNDEIIKKAIEQELEREGQVFYLYNRVESIEHAVRSLQNLMPRISIGLLHGQLMEEEVEETIMDFNKRRYDVLVTTTIIESGIDMPNVNTLIVKRADTFGLSQLYQIRGRVGRGGRKAYAYLFFPKDRALSEQAQKRLNTIYEYQELGSGFKVAMRDLEIRGAGNLLGKEQSGNIAEIGFDLYVQMLNEAVKKLKQEKVEVEIRTVINLPVDFYLPESYIPDTKQKIEFYKRFESAQNLEEVEEITNEMKDRFGEFPKEGETFILMEKIRVLASSLGFEALYESDGEIKMKSGNHFKGNPDKIVKFLAEKSGFSIHPKEPNILKYKPTKLQEKQRLNEIISVLKKIS